MIGLMITAVELVVVFAYTVLAVMARVAVGLVKLIFLLVAGIMGRSRPRASVPREPLER
jgi:uncharacterized protein (DUF58 family)